MLTKSQRGRLSEMGKKSLDHNSKIPEQKAVKGRRGKTRETVDNKEEVLNFKRLIGKEKRKGRIQTGKGFSWIVY